MPLSSYFTLHHPISHTIQISPMWITIFSHDMNFLATFSFEGIRKPKENNVCQWTSNFNLLCLFESCTKKSTQIEINYAIFNKLRNAITVRKKVVERGISGLITCQNSRRNHLRDKAKELDEMNSNFRYKSEPYDM